MVSDLEFKIINTFISFIFFIYYVFIQKYIINRYTEKTDKSQLFQVYWLDYNIIIFFLLSISILFTINLYINDQIDNINVNDNNILNIIFSKYFPFLFSTNFIVDIMLSIHLLLKILKIKKIKNKYYSIKDIRKYFSVLDFIVGYKDRFFHNSP